MAIMGDKLLLGIERDITAMGDSLQNR